MKKKEKIKFKHLFAWICVGGLATLVLTVLVAKCTVDRIIEGIPVSPLLPVIPFLIWALISGGIVLYYAIKFWRESK